MATILRADTPKALRDLDASLNNPAVTGRMVLSLIFALAGPIVVVMSAIGGNWIGAGVAVAWTLAWTGWIVRYWHRLKAARPYRVPVRLGLDLIESAHYIYRRLSPDSAEPALSLIKTMYRLSVVDVVGDLGIRRVVIEMKNREYLLQNLLDAEEKVEVATALHALNDRDDLDAVRAWRDAIAEVNAKLSVGDLAP